MHEQELIEPVVPDPKEQRAPRRIFSEPRKSILQSPELLKAVFFSIFSLSVAMVWPILSRGEYARIFWWNGWIYFTTLSMVCLSFSRLFGVKHAMPLPEVVYGLIMARGLNWFLVYVRPSNKVAAADQLLLTFDARTFGHNAGLIMSQLFFWYPGAGKVFILIHKALPLALVLAYLALPNSKQVRRQYCILIALAAVIIFGVMYGLCPGAGPAYAFGNDFPFAVPTLEQPHPIILGNSQLNTTPSGHLAWAILMFWFGRKYCVRKLTHWLLGAFVVGTAIATMGTGEHYLIDLILAVPFAVAIWELHLWRWKTATAWLLLVGLWEVAVRTGWALVVPPPAVWVLALATMAGPFCFRPLARWRVAESSPWAPLLAEAQPGV